MSTREFIKPVSLKADWPIILSFVVVGAAYAFTPRYGFVRGALFSTLGQTLFIAGAIALPLSFIALKRRRDLWGLASVIIAVGALIQPCRELLSHFR